MLAVDVARNRQHRNPARRPTRRVQGAAARRRLDDQDRVGDRRHDAVTGQELPGLGDLVRRIGREHGAPARDDPLAEPCIARREEAAVAAAQNRDGGGAGLERALVGGGVDPERQSRDDAAPRAAELGGEPTGEAAAVRGGRPGTYDCNGGQLQGGKVAAAPQARRGGLEAAARPGRLRCGRGERTTGRSSRLLHAPRARLLALGGGGNR